MPRTRKRRRSRRGPARARRAPARKAGAPRARPARRDPREVIAGLEQRHLDLVGVGVYLGCALYGGWDGGPVGEWLTSALASLAGRIAYIVPLALVGWG